jgi:Carboxypeptidase regulatory-like domain
MGQAGGQPQLMWQRATGTITDALARPVDGVDVIFQTQNGQIIARARSDRSGRFEFGYIRPGTYAVVASKGGFATAASIVPVTANGARPLVISMAAQTALNMQIMARRLDVAHNGLSPETGGSVYSFSEKAMRDLPQGSNTQMSNVLLQAPEVAEDSYGALHIRREHAEIQYRIKGIELPEGVTSGFSQTFSPRFAEGISLLEGALPAE